MATKKKMLQAAAGNAGGGAGGAALDITDVFSTYLYEGNGGSQSIVNGIALGGDTGGAISLQAQADGLEIPQSSDFNFGTGDFTCEAWIYLEGTNSTYRTMLGFDTTGGLLFEVHTMKLDFGVRGTASNYSTSTLTADQWNHVAIVRSSGTAYWFINGTLDKTDASTFSSTDFSNATAALIGDYAKNTTNFDGSISNLRVSNVARYTSSFTPSTTPLTSDSSTVLLIGQNPDPFADNSSSSHSVSAYGSPAKSGVGPFTAVDAGEGGLVWIKRRTTVSDHELYDTERGATYSLSSNATYASTLKTTGLTSFNSNGFTVGSRTNVNASGNDLASWTFRKAPKFFDVVTYTGDTVAGRAVSHNLGSVPGMIMVKRLNTSEGWFVYHRGMDATAPENYYLQLNTAEARVDGTAWNDTAPTDTHFVLDADSAVNASGNTYVAYLFAHNDGDGEFGPNADQDIIKCGSYIGNGLDDGPEIDLGFEPQWVLVKSATAASTNWILLDNMRGFPSPSSATSTATLFPNLSNITGFNTRFFPTATGFKVDNTGSWVNASGGTYIYMAIRRGPLAQPESGTEVFASYIAGQGASDPALVSGFVTDFATRMYRGGGIEQMLASRLQGGKYLETSNTAVEQDAGLDWDYQTGWYDGLGNSLFMSHMWKRAPGFCDVVAYSGNSTAGRTVSHNLGVVPEMMWVKSRSKDENWVVYHEGLGSPPEENYIYLNGNWVKNYDGNTIRLWNHTSPTDSEFTLGIESRVNLTGHTYIAYLFATVPGVSKVGSYTGNGSSQTIDCGFTSGARFVLIKRTDSTGDWNVYDTERGIVAGNDSRMSLNTTDAEDTSNDRLDPSSSGFVVNYIATGTSDSNISGASYIFYAIA